MKRRRSIVGGATVLLLTAVLGACGPVLSPWQGELVSVNPAGTDAGSGRSDGPVFSPDGTKIAFVSDAADLGPTDSNTCTQPGPEPVTKSCSDVYLRDLSTGTTTLVSVNAAGNDSANGNSYTPVFSPDGTKIAFGSTGSNLGPADTNGTADVYLRDLVAGTTSLVSVNAAGTNGGNGDSGGPAYSPDGTRIAFNSDGSDFGPSDTRICDFFGFIRPCSDIYVRDLTTGTTSLVTSNITGSDGGDTHTFGSVQFVAGGTKAIFESAASDLTGTRDTNEAIDVFVRDFVTNTTSLVTINAFGTASAGGHSNGNAVASEDGQRVVFASDATDLTGTPDTNFSLDVFVRDLATNTTTLVSINAAGTAAGDEQSFTPTISRDGSKVAFSSAATDLGPPSDGTFFNVYVRDLASGTISLASGRTDGVGSTGFASSPFFSPDGNTVGYQSTSTDLGPVDTNAASDIYVHDLTSGTTSLVSTRADGRDSSDGESGQPVFSPNGRQIAFHSLGSNLGHTDTNGLFDVYVATLHAADLRVFMFGQPDRALSGGSLRYFFFVTNSGPETAEVTRVAILLPQDQPPFNLPEGCVQDPPVVVICDIGVVAAGGEASRSFDISVNAPPGSTLKALAFVTSEKLDLAPVDNVSTVETPVD